MSYPDEENEVLELIGTPSNPIPQGATVSAVRTSDGRTLRVANWAPGHRTRGTVALFQGRAEFIEKYFETVNELLARGFQVVAMDWRGQGGSERELANSRKGHVDDFALYQRDLEAFLQQVVEFLCPEPWFALAHSMGAAILLEQAHRGRSPFRRLVLTAPMIDIAAVRFPRVARSLADTLDMIGLGAMFVPGGKETTLEEEGFVGNKLTSDAARFARNAEILRNAPRLAVGDPTIGWLNAAFRQMKQFAAPEYLRGARTPALLVGGGRDKIASLRAIEQFAARLELADLVVVPGARHEILMENDALRGQFWAAFDAFVPGTEAVISRQ